MDVNLIFVLIFSRLNSFLNAESLQPFELCADENCNGVISKAITSQKYQAVKDGFLSFSAEEEVRIFKKNVNGSEQYWLAELRDIRGYIPSKLVKETSTFVHTQHLHKVPRKIYSNNGNKAPLNVDQSNEIHQDILHSVDSEELELSMTENIIDSRIPSSNSFENDTNKQSINIKEDRGTELNNLDNKNFDSNTKTDHRTFNNDIPHAEPIGDTEADLQNSATDMSKEMDEQSLQNKEAKVSDKDSLSQSDQSDETVTVNVSDIPTSRKNDPVSEQNESSPGMENPQMNENSIPTQPGALNSPQQSANSHYVDEKASLDSSTETPYVDPTSEVPQETENIVIGKKDVDIPEVTESSQHTSETDNENESNGNGEENGAEYNLYSNNSSDVQEKQSEEAINVIKTTDESLEEIPSTVSSETNEPSTSLPSHVPSDTTNSDKRSFAKSNSDPSPPPLIVPNHAPLPTYPPLVYNRKQKKKDVIKDDESQEIHPTLPPDSTAQTNTESTSEHTFINGSVEEIKDNLATEFSSPKEETILTKDGVHPESHDGMNYMDQQINEDSEQNLDDNVINEHDEAAQVSANTKLGSQETDQKNLDTDYVTDNENRNQEAHFQPPVSIYQQDSEKEKSTDFAFIDPQLDGLDSSQEDSVPDIQDPTDEHRQKHVSPNGICEKDHVSYLKDRFLQITGVLFSEDLSMAVEAEISNPYMSKGKLTFLLLIAGTIVVLYFCHMMVVL